MSTSCEDIIRRQVSSISKIPGKVSSFIGLGDRSTTGYFSTSQIPRAASFFIGFGNEPTSGYTAAQWDAEMCSRDLSPQGSKSASLRSSSSSSSTSGFSESSASHLATATNVATINISIDHGDLVTLPNPPDSVPTVPIVPSPPIMGNKTLGLVQENPIEPPLYDTLILDNFSTLPLNTKDDKLNISDDHRDLSGPRPFFSSPNLIKKLSVFFGAKPDSSPPPNISKWESIPEPLGEGSHLSGTDHGHDPRSVSFLSSPNLRKKSSVYIGGPSDPLPPPTITDHKEEDPPHPPDEISTRKDSEVEKEEATAKTPSFQISQVRKKMSIFLGMARPSLTQESSDVHDPGHDDNMPSIDGFTEQDLPSFYTKRRRSNDSNHSEAPSNQPAGQGKQQRRMPKTRKLGAAMQSQHQVHLLTNLQLIAITFFAVSGGPYGFEPTVGAGGPGLMLVGLLFFPVLWAAPLAYMTAELSCMIPESGGHVLWVYRAFGPFWSFVNSCFAFACSILDNAMYPVLFVEYLSALFYEGRHNISYGWSVFLKIFIVFLVTVINIIGVDIVGFASLALGLMVLAPLAIMCLVGLFHLNFDWMDSDSGSASTNGSAAIDWHKFVTLLLWNTSGFDAAGTCAAEVRNPGHSYPHALAVSLALIVGVYALPTIIGVSVLPDTLQWKEGTYVIVAKLIGGTFLESWMGFSAAASALGLLLTRLCFNSRIVYGMALVEQVPPVFSKIHPEYATPWVAILATSFCTLLLSGFNFYSIAEADMLFYACSTILKFGALVQLRFTEPDAFRPYRIPIENIPLAICSLIPIGLCGSIIWLSSEYAHGIMLAGAAIAILLFIAKEMVHQYMSEAEESMTNRMTRFQENMNKMQKRIDSVIAEEFAAPLSNLGHAIHVIPQLQRLRSGFRRHVVAPEEQVDRAVEQGRGSDDDDNIY